MRVLLSGGGTAGHINPAIAIAQHIQKEDRAAVICFVGTPSSIECKIVKDAGFDFEELEVKGFKRSFSKNDILHNIKAVRLLLSSKKKARDIINEFKPDIVIGTGGYVSGPIVLAATKMGIKTAIHEQNAFPGVTTKLLAKKVDLVFLAVNEAKNHLDKNIKVEVVGNPVRDSIIFSNKEKSRQKLLLEDKFCILSFGGSLGADTINKIAADLIKWHNNDDKIYHIHGYGRLGKQKFPEYLKDRKIDIKKSTNTKINEFIDDMDICLAAADIVICRSGAITLSELQVTGKASILIPSPNVTANHQYHNAMVLKCKNAAFLIEEKDYDKGKIVDIVKELYENREKLKELGDNALQLAVIDTTRLIYDKIKVIVNN